MIEMCPYWKECAQNQKTGWVLALCASEYPTDPQRNDLTSGRCSHYGEQARDLAFREAAILEFRPGGWVSEDGRQNIRVVAKAPYPGPEGVQKLRERWPQALKNFDELCARKASK